MDVALDKLRYTLCAWPDMVPMEIDVPCDEDGAPSPDAPEEGWPTDRHGRPLTERESRSAARRWEDSWYETFVEECGDEILRRNGHYWRFPYTEPSHALAAYDGPVLDYVDDYDGIRTVGTAKWEQFTSARERVGAHALAVIEAIEGGAIRTDGGITPIKTSLVDGQASVDITPVIRASIKEGTGIGVGSLGGYIGCWQSPFAPLARPLPLALPGEPTVWVPVLPIGWEGERLAVHLVRDLSEKSGYRCSCTHGGGETQDWPSPLDDWLFCYYMLCALVGPLGCGGSVRAAIYPRKQKYERRGAMPSKLKMPNDMITNSLFMRDKNAIVPADYFAHRKPDEALKLITGRRGSVGLVIVPGETPVDAAVESYRLSPEDRFWLEAVCSLANDGVEVVRGSEILKFNGYRNPSQASCEATMRRAYESIRKMTLTRLAIDTTNEVKGYRGLRKAFDERPIIDGRWRLLLFVNGSRDFELTLNTGYDGTALGAMPLAVYAADKSQLLTAERSEMEFRGLRPTLEHRLMWRYVTRRMSSHSTSGTILFDTILRNSGIDSPERHKRAKLERALVSMLEARKGEGKIDFSAIERSGRLHSVTITSIRCGSGARSVGER